MDLKKISELNYWQWFGICLVGLLLISSHQLFELAKVKSPIILLMLAGVFIIMAAVLAFVLKWSYSKSRFAKIFSKRPFKQLINSGFQITDDHITGTIDGYTCKVGIAFSDHLMEFVWYELFFSNPSKSKEDWKLLYSSLKRQSSKKTEWQYNKIRRNYLTYVMRVNHEKLISDIRETIELLHLNNLKAK